jgi:polar amino acid transport system permease protein
MHAIEQFIRRHKLWDIIGYAACMAVGIIWLLTSTAADQGYNWQWYRVPRYLFTTAAAGWESGPLLKGVGLTLVIAAVSLVFTNIIGLLTALMRLGDSWIAARLARLYLEFTRNTPLLVQIFFVYFVLAPILKMDRFSAGIMALSLFEGAYASEIYRSGIVSIDKGQWDAAQTLGMSRYHTYRHIVLPQAVRRMLPPLTGQSVSLIKDSSLLSVIAIAELTTEANIIVAETFLVFEIYFVIAAVYLFLNLILSRAVAFFEGHRQVVT